MIDALFGSKTRVKLLHLFLNNPGSSFYVREITRLIDEQINSVRRELSNMLSVGIIVSKTSDNKLYYEVNQRYEHYVALKSIFADREARAVTKTKIDEGVWFSVIEALKGTRVIVAAGILVNKKRPGSVDLLVVGDDTKSKIKAAVKQIEEHENREINYSSITYDEFYYRLSVRDKFMMEILNNEHRVVLDADNILKGR